MATSQITSALRAQIYLAVKDPDGPKLSQVKAGETYGVSKTTVGRIIKDFDERRWTIKKIKDEAASGIVKSKVEDKPQVSQPVLETTQELQHTTPVVEKKEPTYVMGPTFINLTDSSGKLFTVNSKSEKFKGVREMIIRGDIESAIALVDTARVIEKYSKGMLTVDGDQVMYAGKDVSNAVVGKIRQAFSSGDGKLESLCNFLKRLLDNPSKNSIDLLWGFIEHNDVTLDDDGFIIAWKKVQSSPEGLFDSHTGKIPNDLGTVVKMIRQHVVEDPNVTCTHGLHVGAWNYVGSFSGDTILRVKIAPEDVVSVPKDYNAMKMRVAKYFVDAIVNRDQEIVKQHVGAPSRFIRAGQNGVWEEETQSAW